MYEEHKKYEIKSIKLQNTPRQLCREKKGKWPTILQFFNAIFCLLIRQQQERRQFIQSVRWNKGIRDAGSTADFRILF